MDNIWLTTNCPMWQEFTDNQIGEAGADLFDLSKVQSAIQCSSLKAIFVLDDLKASPNNLTPVWECILRMILIKDVCLEASYSAPYTEPSNDLSKWKHLSKILSTVAQTIETTSSIGYNMANSMEMNSKAWQDITKKNKGRCKIGSKIREIIDGRRRAKLDAKMSQRKHCYIDWHDVSADGYSMMNASAVKAAAGAVRVIMPTNTKTYNEIDADLWQENFDMFYDKINEKLFDSVIAEDDPYSGYTDYEIMNSIWDAPSLESSNGIGVVSAVISVLGGVAGAASSLINNKIEEIEESRRNFSECVMKFVDEMNTMCEYIDDTIQNIMMAVGEMVGDEHWLYHINQIDGINIDSVCWYWYSHYRNYIKSSGITTTRDDDIAVALQTVNINTLSGKINKSASDEAYIFERSLNTTMMKRLNDGTSVYREEIYKSSPTATISIPKFLTVRRMMMGYTYLNKLRGEKISETNDSDFWGLSKYDKSDIRGTIQYRLNKLGCKCSWNRSPILETASLLEYYMCTQI